MSLYPDHVVVQLRHRRGELELAMSASSLMGFQSWLEAGPPGTATDACEPPAATTVRRAQRGRRVFVLNGFCFASLFSRVPDLRSGLDLDNGALGLLLLAGAAGSVLALPASRRG